MRNGKRSTPRNHRRRAQSLPLLVVAVEVVAVAENPSPGSAGPRCLRSATVSGSLKDLQPPTVRRGVRSAASSGTSEGDASHGESPIRRRNTGGRGRTGLTLQPAGNPFWPLPRDPAPKMPQTSAKDRAGSFVSPRCSEPDRAIPSPESTDSPSLFAAFPF